MGTISIDCDDLREKAIISANSDCTDVQWGAIRRFFEERFPQQVNNRHRAIEIAWWAFLSLKDSFRVVLQVQEISDLNITPVARQLLQESLVREARYRQVTVTSVRDDSEIQDVLRGKGWQRNLMPYQLRNVALLCRLPAAATFSVPGAGKTTEALAYFYLTAEESDKLLVVAPKNAFVAWEDELPKCVPSESFSFVRLIGGQARIGELLETSPKAVLISYQQLYRVRDELTQYMIRNRVYLFIDESHRMKRGQDGVHGSAILSLAPLAANKLILSGTPMPNSVADLVPQFSFLYPELSSNTENVLDNLRSIFVRTTKSELGLKEPRRLLQVVPMLPGQKKLYESLASDAARMLLGLSARDRITLRKIARSVQHLLQAASNPALLVNSELSGHPLLEESLKEGLSSKLETACSLARKWVGDGQKVVIWSTFVKSVEHLAGLLVDCGALFIHGGVETGEEDDAEDTREKRIRAFNNPNSANYVLVANPAACAEGISLHQVCHRAIYVDRNFNAAQYLQSEDRIHRIGLPPDIDTTITILSSPATIDESVARRLEAKVNLMRQILNDPNLNITPLDLDDDDDLFGLTAADIEDLKGMLRL